ncbi:MAG: hypothetical protein IPO92_08000 [Saprospiraceae bacterium]|nr:hypothetical protein [Saprospiraceae bacterium]
MKNYSVVKVIIMFTIAIICFMACKPTKEKVEIKSLSWLQGSWLTADSTTIETWAIQNGEVSGNAFSQKAGKITERLRIFDDNGKIFYEATVLDQNESKAIQFELESYSGDSLYFVNLKHDFPNYIVYKKTSDSTIYTKVYGKSNEGFSAVMTKLVN